MQSEVFIDIYDCIILLYTLKLQFISELETVVVEISVGVKCQDCVTLGSPLSTSTGVWIFFVYYIPNTSSVTPFPTIFSISTPVSMCLKPLITFSTQPSTIGYPCVSRGVPNSYGECQEDFKIKIIKLHMYLFHALCLGAISKTNLSFSHLFNPSV